MQHNFLNRITFQWHITDVCNYRCKHCYQSDYVEIGASFDEQKSFLMKFKKFVDVLKFKNKNLKVHINFTGGEPFLRGDFLDLLKKTNDINLFTFGILSNGFLLPKEQLITLAELKPKFIQISLEGNEQMNDNIRGKGSFKEVIKAIKTYSSYKIPVVISFTANAENYKVFPEVVKIAQKHKVSKVWTDRYLPINKSDKLLMTTEQTKDFFEIILKEQDKNKRKLFSKTKVSSNRALQFLVTGGMPYKCSAGQSLFAILPNGDILPCRRLPIKIGNLKEDSLIDIYNNNNTVNELRNHDKIDSDCLNCYYKKTCYGGLKCLTYATLGNAFGKDTNCWI